MSSLIVKSKRSGFTLIELLVVIAIIAILAAILFPVFAKAREKARQTSCLSQTKQLGLGFIQYYQDYDEKLPSGTQNTTANPYPDHPGVGWGGQIYSEIKSVDIYKCPDDSTAQVNATGGTAAQVPVSYGFNSNAAGQTQALYNNVAKSILAFEITGNQADVTTAGSTASPSFGDTNSVAGDGQNSTATATANGEQGMLGGGNNSTSTPLYATGILTGSGATAVGTATGNFATLTGRHTDGANYLLADGHSKWLRSTSVSAGLNNATANACGMAGNNAQVYGGPGNDAANTAANSGCSATLMAATFSVN